MDCNMPIMDGFEATQELRRLIASQSIRGPNYTHIIALTAYANDHFKEKCLSSGMEQVLTKPISSA